MGTIPASSIVRVFPGVLAAAGLAAALTGLMLTTSTRAPIGSVPSFPNAPAVAAYFGSSSPEYAEAQVYFTGPDNSLTKPAALKYAQYNAGAVAAYLRGGSLATMTLAQLQALTGQLIVTIDGTTFTSSTINLSAATSFSNAATLIQTALGASDGVGTGTIANLTDSITGGISGNILTVATPPTSVYIAPGTGISGSGVTAGSAVQKQLTGTPGGVGTYQLSATSTLAPGSTITLTNGLMTITAVTSGTFAVGQNISGTDVAAGTVVVALGNGTGGTGTYQVTPGQIISSEQLTAGAATVTFDSVLQAFVITSGSSGAVSTIGFATGSLAAPLLLGATNGGVVSKGADPQTPNSAMTWINGVDQNWGAFMTLFAPTVTDQLGFAAWNNAQLDSDVYVLKDTSAAPTVAGDTSSVGYQIKQAGYEGVALVWGQSGDHIAAATLSYFASIAFQQQGGRQTLAFAQFSGLTPAVTDGTTAANLQANGYSYYGAYGFKGEPNPDNIIYPGSITGQFLWADSYANQQWMNSNFLLAGWQLLKAVRFIPYNPKGYSLIDSAYMDPITQALNFGAIQQNVTLSPAEAAEVDQQAGITISPTLQTRGWYLQILDPPAAVRAKRGTPPMKFWYMDGESVQSLSLSSIAIQ